ncbi:hypothetical protein COOONC_20679 [Cooperia oncophora]
MVGGDVQFFQAACELSRTETRTKDDKEDAAREKEEQRLWSEDRLIQNATPKKEESPSPAKGAKNLPVPRSPEARNTSPWRTQRRAVAVVRPQPVVVMRSSSPVPKLAETNGRPSRLPLSTANREKEALKKAATSLESQLPRPPSRTSSTRNAMSTSTSSLETSSKSSVGSNSFGLRRSSTTSNFGNGSTSTSSFSLSQSRSSSNLRRPSYGLSRVSSHSTLERKPGHLSMKVRPTDSYIATRPHASDFASLGWPHVRKWTEYVR